MKDAILLRLVEVGATCSAYKIILAEHCGLLHYIQMADIVLLQVFARISSFPLSPKEVSDEDNAKGMKTKCANTACTAVPLPLWKVGRFAFEFLLIAFAHLKEKKLIRTGQGSYCSNNITNSHLYCIFLSAATCKKFLLQGCCTHVSTPVLIITSRNYW